MINGIGMAVHWEVGISKYRHYRKGTACWFLQPTKLREKVELVIGN